LDFGARGKDGVERFEVEVVREHLDDAVEEVSVGSGGIIVRTYLDDAVEEVSGGSGSGRVKVINFGGISGGMLLV
jgi:hypothetical protein